MLRAAFWLTALLLIPLGLFVFFLPPSLAALAGISPLWLARVSGGLLMTWGVHHLAASVHPDGSKVVALVVGNLLMVAALVPALLGAQVGLPPSLKSLLTLLAAALTLLAVIAILTFPARRPSL